MTLEQRLRKRERDRVRSVRRRAALKALVLAVPKWPDDGGDLAGLVAGGLADDVGLARRGGILRSVRK